MSYQKSIGLSFFLGAASKEVLGGDEVQELLLEDGRRIETDLILVSAGVRPNLDLAQKMGLKTGKGVPAGISMSRENKRLLST